MISIRNKTKCCGCTACASICPRHCIVMKEDEEGFLYPDVDSRTCIECGACEMVCPVLHSGDTRKPLRCYAAKNKDKELLRKSSSGGVFSLLAMYVIQSKHGVVFGAMWDGDKVVHGALESVEELDRFRGSKYTQSDLQECFIQVSQFLKDGRYVLFSGTPCEIAGLKSYLRKDYDTLLTVDLACHGAPSPKILSMYIQELKEWYGVDTLHLNFKDKSTGWATYSVSAWHEDQLIFIERATDNIYMRGYLHELFSRPSCHDCAFKSFRSGSDITLADFWGIERVMPKYKILDGVSLVIINTIKAEGVITKITEEGEFFVVTYDDAVRDNGALVHSERPHPQRSRFFKRIRLGVKISSLISDNLHLTRLTRVKLFCQSIYLKIFNK